MRQRYADHRIPDGILEHHFYSPATSVLDVGEDCPPLNIHQEKYAYTVSVLLEELERVNALRRQHIYSRKA